MAHVALYRKYRSQTFSDLVGQEHVVRTLQSAIARGHIAHAYLFTGPRGTGKTSTARLLAKALNCEKGPAPEPCNVCDACVSITNGSAMDVKEMDAASESGIDAVRQHIVEAVDYRPAVCRFRVFIIDEVHDLSRNAFDALLKTIEEPPDHVVFILATTESSKVPPTIRSRCQRYEFHRGTIQDLARRLEHVAQAEGIDIEPAAIGAIARMADGGYRDALTLLEQAMVTVEGRVGLAHVYDQIGLVAEDTIDDLLRAIVAKDVPKVTETLEEVYRRGRDPRALLESVLTRLADLTRAAYGVDVQSGGDSAVEASRTAIATELGLDRILMLRASLADVHRDIGTVTIPRLWLEASLVKVVLAGAMPAPAQSSVQSTTVAPAPTPSAARPKEAPAPSPALAAPVARPAAATPPAPVDDPALAPHDARWRTVVDELSSISPLARERLSTSRVGRLKGTTVVVEFPRDIDVDLVKNSTKLLTAIRDSWQKHGAGDFSLDFGAAPKGGPAPTTPTPTPHERTAVELPLEGERLVEAARATFETPDLETPSPKTTP